MATLERTYIIPIRRETLKVPKYRRAKKAATAVREFLQRHLKSDHVLLGTHLNEHLWQRGMKSPPGKVKVTVQKKDDGTVTAELFGIKFDDHKPAEQSNAKKQEKQQQDAPGKKEEAKKEKKEETTAAASAQEKMKESPKAQDKKQPGSKKGAQQTLTSVAPDTKK